MERLLVALCVTFLASTDCSLHETWRLLRHTLRLYNSDLIPQPTDQPLPVAFVPMIYDVISLEPDTGRLTVQLQLLMSWPDLQLTWEPEQYREVHYVHFAASHIWLPDLRVLNGIQTDPSTAGNVKLLYNGTVCWEVQLQATVSCLYHAHDHLWSCPLHFGSSSYSAADLDLVAADRSLRIVERLKHDWLMMAKSGKRKRMYKKHALCCDDQTAVSWHYELILQNRRSSKLLTYA